MQPGDKVKYRSIAGDLYDAVITALQPSGEASIEVAIPGVRAPFELRRVSVSRLDGIKTGIDDGIQAGIEFSLSGA